MSSDPPIPENRSPLGLLELWRVRLLDEFLLRLSDSGPREREGRTTLLLGGGGAKGCFQAGAIAYLAHSDDPDLKPNLICGTSVGAVNGILAAENTNVTDNSRVRRLIEVWLELDSVEDFFIHSPDLVRIDDDLPGLLKSLTGVSLTSFGSTMLGPGYNLHVREVPEWVIRGSADWGFLGLIGGAAWVVGGAPATLAMLTAGVVMFREIEAGVDDIQQVRSFYSLAPVRQLIRDNMNETLLRSEEDQSFRERVKLGAMEFRMVSVEARTGLLCWVNSLGSFNSIDEPLLTADTVGRPPSITTHTALFREGISSATGLRGPLTYALTIEEGTLGSAAIPVAFPPAKIYLTDSFTHRPDEVATLLDGGVHDVLPTQAALDYLYEANDLGLRNVVITVPTGPMFNNAPFFETNRSILEEIEPEGFMQAPTRYWNIPNVDVDRLRPDFPGEKLEGTNILDIAFQAIDLQMGEGGRTDRLELEALPFDVEEILIAPSFGVNGTGQIDKGLIRIQIAYGWMRACDMIFLRQRRAMLEDGTVRDDTEAFAPFFDAYATSDLITRLRMNCWRLEMRYTPRSEEADSFPGDHFWFEEGVIEQLRATKRRIASTISTRWDIYRGSGLAPFPTAEFMPDDLPDTWVDFEKHSPESFWFFDDIQDDDPFMRTEAFEFLQSTSLWTTSFRTRGGPPVFSGRATRPVVPSS